MSSPVAYLEPVRPAPRLRLVFDFEATHRASGVPLREWVRDLPERAWDPGSRCWVVTGLGPDPETVLRQAGFAVVGPDDRPCDLAGYVEPLVVRDEAYGMTSVTPRLLGRDATASLLGLDDATPWRGSERRWLVPDGGSHSQTCTHGQQAALPPLRFDGSLDGLRGVPVTDLACVDPATARALEQVGVCSVHDLLHTLPRRYLDRSSPEPVAGQRPGATVTFLGTVVSVKAASSPAGPSIVLVRDAAGPGAGTAVACRWFRARWVTRRLRPGLPVLVHGRLETWTGRDGTTRYGLTNPLVDPVTPEEAGPGAPPVIGIYPASAKAGLSTWQVHHAVKEALARLGPVADPLDEQVRSSRGLPGRTAALTGVHLPAGLAQARAARDRLAYDELLRLQLALAVARAEQARQPARPIRGDGSITSRLLAALPYRLTGAQARAVGEISADMASDRAMHRLLQGEVGSGKTLVAALALATAVEAGCQAVLLAPTEVLASQHLAELEALLSGAGVSVGLLTNKVTGAARKSVLAGLADGSVRVLVGTHAVLAGAVAFHRLGLAVVDEQHRFGTQQRAALRDKGAGALPDVLYATATPIPRTAAMTVFGDLDVSVLDEMPPGRSPVATVHVPTDAATDEPAAPHWAAVREQAAAGRQAFVVCPLVASSATRQANAAHKVAARLATGALAGLRLAVVTGKDGPAERAATMAAFAGRDLDVLVATTVIEVGVNVPNATVMIVLEADRFGLAQLHQIRGRVGRGAHPGTCFLVSRPRTAQATQRIQAMLATTDGFVLAERDLAIRGVGSVLGPEQSGTARDLRVADLLADAELAAWAKADAQRLTASDPHLDRHPVLRAEVAAALGPDAAGWLTTG